MCLKIVARLIIINYLIKVVGQMQWSVRIVHVVPRHGSRQEQKGEDVVPRCCCLPALPVRKYSPGLTQRKHSHRSTHASPVSLSVSHALQLNQPWLICLAITCIASIIYTFPKISTLVVRSLQLPKFSQNYLDTCSDIIHCCMLQLTLREERGMENCWSIFIS